MTDIVDRLLDYDSRENPQFVRLEAAREIERMRAEIVLLEATGAHASDEIDRLRGVLRQIAVNADRTDASPYMLLVGCGLIAEKALDGVER